MAIETPKSPVIPIFLVICVLGCLLTAAGGGYLYFKWESHFPPLADLQNQVKATRGASEAEKKTAKDPKRSRVPEWTEELSAQYSNRSNDMAARMERDLAKAQAAAEAAEPAKIEPGPSNRSGLAAIQRALAEQRSSAQTGAAMAKTNTLDTKTTEAEASPLKSGGTIEKMNNDWLPPGVSKSE